MNRASLEMLIAAKGLEVIGDETFKFMLNLPFDKAKEIINVLKSYDKLDPEAKKILDFQYYVFDKLDKLQTEVREYAEKMEEQAEEREQVEFLKKVEPPTKNWN